VYRRAAQHYPERIAHPGRGYEIRVLDLVGGSVEGDSAARQRRPDAGGPGLLAAKIDDAPGIGQTPRDPPLIRVRVLDPSRTCRSRMTDSRQVDYPVTPIMARSIWSAAK
jgi:hypothetical protein